MRRTRAHTVRAKLTLTTTLAMALVLVALGFIVDQGTRRVLLSTIDADIRSRGASFARGQEHARDHPMDGPPPAFMALGMPPMREPHQENRNRENRNRERDNTRPRFISASQSSSFGDWHEAPYDREEYRAALDSKKARIATVDLNGEPFRLFSQPVIVDGKVVGVAQVGHSLTDVYRALGGLRRLLLSVVVPFGALLAGLASLFIVSRALRPVRMIAENARSIGARNLEERLPVVGQDEFAGLATTLNGMLGRLEEAFRLEQATTRRLAETVEQQRRFTADASHELKTPLATVKAHAGLLNPQDPDDRESVEAIAAAANRMRSLVDDLLVLARADGGQLTARTAPVDLEEVIGAATAAVSPLAVEVSAQPLVLEGNGEALTRLFINLLDNAKKHAESKSPIEIQMTRQGDDAEIAITDHGIGIAPEHLPRLFDRFYRPDTSRTSETGGTGLGLAICREIAAAHRGTIEVISRLGQGTTFKVRLPLA